MLKKITSLLLSLGLSAAAAGGLTVTASAAETRSAYGDYKDGWYHISNAEQLVALSEASENTGSPVLTSKFVLDNDIVLSPTYDNEINIAPDSDSPFAGVFDGNGHTISGLSHSTYDTDPGLFGFTDGAEIKNLVIENANMQMINRGGIIAGHSENTKFFNLSVRNSRVRIISGGVALELLTADGVTLGGLVGEAIEGSLMYNCETVDVFIDTGEAEGVGALGGDGYFIGGLVGTLDGSHIEYSRTVSQTNTDSGKIEADLVVAVSALSFKNIYVGGIVGEMKNGASVIDSFSNLALYSDPATGVTVIGAVYGYLGGIAGITWGTKCKIERCHYSGTAYQKDFGGLLIVVPVDNTHRGGVIGCIDGYDDPILAWEPTEVGGIFNNLYFNYDRVMEATGSGDKYDDECSVAYEYLSAGRYSAIPSEDLPTCASLSQEQYADESLWSENGFDFDGSILRDTPCNVFFEDEGNGGQHINQWIMHTYNYLNIDDTAYAETTMPIHGKTNVDIYSNEYNAFIDENAESTVYNYTVSDNKVSLPTEENMASIDPKLQNQGFVGFAFVSERQNEAADIVYTCDALYLPDTEVDADVFETYGTDPDKRIYAVWCQANNVGAQLGLNSGNRGVRVLTAVNTELLSNIGLEMPDKDYERGATFTVDGNEYLIKADSGVWYGETYKTGKDIEGVDNARVFSIFAQPGEDDYDKEITYQGDILYHGITGNGESALFDFLCGEEQSLTISNIARQYLSDLKESGKSERDNYGLTDEQYDVLTQYID